MTKTNKEAKNLRISAALCKIKAQFPKTHESKLMFSIIKQAAIDLNDRSKSIRNDAKHYLKNAVHAEMCGVDKTWVSETFEKLGVSLDSEFIGNDPSLEINDFNSI